jgi:SAM-dependent methyltransferase
MLDTVLFIQHMDFTHIDIVLILKNRHSTAKCIEWARERFHQLGLSNVTPKLITGMENLDFASGSFDLVVAGYGLANSSEPQAVLNEIHRVLKPGGSFLGYVWEQLPADPGSDIILRHACVGPNPWHKADDGTDTVGSFRCPVRTHRAMSLAKPHLRKYKHFMICNDNICLQSV